jgi:hypothetical protein
VPTADAIAEEQLEMDFDRAAGLAQVIDHDLIPEGRVQGYALDPRCKTQDVKR